MSDPDSFSSSDVGLYEPIWKADQQLVQASFLPFRVTGTRHLVWREFWAICEMYRQGVHRKHRFTGLMSPRFGEKTGLTAESVLQYVAVNHDCDICIFNPFPQMPYIYFNVWDHREHNHPGIVVRGQQLLAAVGIDLGIDTVDRHGPSVCCYANYWVGTTRFWDAYVGEVLMPIATFLEQQPDHPASLAVMEEAEYEVSASHLPFIIERLFTSFVAQRPHVSRATWLRDPVSASLHDVQREIVVRLKSEVDEADSRGVFPKELRERMSLLARLVTLYEIQYYALNPRPFAGRILPFKRRT